MWVDESFGEGDEFGVTAGAAAHFADFAGGCDVQAAIAGDFFDAGLAVGDVGDGTSEGNGDFDGSLGFVEAGTKEFDFDNFESGMLIFDEALSVQTDERRVVLVDALDGDAVESGAGGFGQGGAPGDVGFVENAGPIDSANDDGFVRAEEDEADGFELVVAIDNGLDPAAAEGMADGGSDVEAEGGDEEVGGFSRG